MRSRLLPITALVLFASAPIVYAATFQTPLAVVSTVQANAGTTTERSMCVAIGIVKDVANQCGALRIVHPLPTVRTYSKTRGLSLIYNSDQAVDWVVIHADIALNTGISAPTSVRTTLFERTSAGGEVQIAQRVDAGSAWSSGPQRVGLRWRNAPAGVLPYRIKVEFLVSGTWTSAASPIDGEQVSTGRVGWRVAGVEQLVPVGNDLLWVGGDGSTRLYKYTNRTTYLYPWYTRTYEVASTGVMLAPDTLMSWSQGAGIHYVRYLRGGARVGFDHTGRHFYTRGKMGDSTSFHHNGATGLLESVQVAPHSAGLTYYFEYNGATLSSISSPGSNLGVPRVTSFAHVGGSGDSVTTQIVDPDSTVVTFVRDSLGRYKSRTDRRGTKTSFAYETAAATLASATTEVENSETVVHTFQSAQGRSATTSSPTPLALARKSFYDGPLSNGDTTGFWVNRLGALDSTRNALGQVTRITRDTLYPARVTQVVQASGMTTTSTYDTHGNVASTTQVNPYGNGQNSTTSYVWDQTWDLLTKVKRPEGDSTIFSLNSADGTIAWAQTGPSANRVYFTYGCAGLLQSSTLPGYSALDTVQYSSLCNVIRTVSRTGMESQALQDRLGRDTLAMGGIATAQNLVSTVTRISYTTAGRVFQSRTVSPPKFYSLQSNSSQYATVPGDTLVVTNTYDAEGALTAVVRNAGKSSLTHQGDVSSTYTYDKLQRRATIAEPGSGAIRLRYDKAGRVVYKVSPVGDSVGMEYDVIGHLTRRIEPGRSYAPIGCQTIDPTHVCGYTLPMSGSALVVDADTAVFGYDAAGNMTRADNRYARVRRTFYANGAIKRDSSLIRTVDSSTSGSSETINGLQSPGRSADFAAHVYVLEHKYDRNGREVRLSYPTQFTACGSACVADSMVYNGVGQLATLINGRGHSYQFKYTAAGDLDSLVYPWGLVQRDGFDADGRPTVRTGVGPGARAYDATGKLSIADAYLAGGSEYPLRTVFKYSAMGSLALVDNVDNYNSTAWSEEYRTDAVGTRISSFGSGNSFGDSTVLDTVGRLIRTAPKYANGRTDFTYLADGSTRLTHSTTQPSGSSGIPFPYNSKQSAMYYGSNGMLRFFESRAGSTSPDQEEVMREEGAGVLMEEIRYDALGRRVLLWDNCLSTTCGASTIQRFVWNGAQIVAETRGAGTNATTRESDTPSGNASSTFVSSFGRVWYTHTGGIDHPLAVIRMGGGTGANGSPIDSVMTVHPFTNVQGQYEWGVQYTTTAQNLPTCTGCLPLILPASTQTAFLAERTQAAPFPGLARGAWAGSLLQDQKSASGLTYRRNRYYDSQSGRFTQVDPMGIAGGLNVYGFTAGDPVNFTDPFGLMLFCGPFADCNQNKDMIDNWMSGGGGNPRGIQWTASALAIVGRLCKEAGIANCNITFIQSDACNSGWSMGHFICLSNWSDRSCSVSHLAHEMFHVSQFESMGGRRYVEQLGNEKMLNEIAGPRARRTTYNTAGYREYDAQRFGDRYATEKWC